jgi:hypothetical protein
MVVRVLKPFKDKVTMTIYAKGNEIDVTEERYEELTSAASGPFVQAIGEPKEPTTKKPATKKSTTKKSTTKKNKK